MALPDGGERSFSYEKSVNAELVLNYSRKVIQSREQ